MRGEVVEARFGWQMVPEVHQKFWEAMARGEFIDRPRKRLEFLKPDEVIGPLLLR